MQNVVSDDGRTVNKLPEISRAQTLDYDRKRRRGPNSSFPRPLWRIYSRIRKR